MIESDPWSHAYCRDQTLDMGAFPSFFQPQNKIRGNLPARNHANTRKRFRRRVTERVKIDDTREKRGRWVALDRPVVGVRTTILARANEGILLFS